MFNPSKINLFRYHAPVEVLGPGKRAVIWVQGCPFSCRGCIVPESWSEDTGEAIAVSELAEWILEQPDDIEGITLSGGEPMEQAQSLTQLINIVRQNRDMGVVCYTGYLWEELQQNGTQEQHTLLSNIDLLIDGHYLEQQHDNLRWRGSRNQRLLPLTPRYADEVKHILAHGDNTAGIKVDLDANHQLAFTGVPHVPRFRETLEEKMRAKGVILKKISDQQ
ncbi:MAG: radical SAM protein [Crocosphaera sp.]|uniref:Ribonucleotide reductase of class III (Anaerobic), activating protein n=3 Tax=Crocosphaera watsonii TaxID=263511 RepID=T2K0I3_CROWT|nr:MULTISPECIES: 4Fe-4S cluster-binding domain-containing protein [Crocosphaera]MCH2231594.1 radical SAM protein [Crocinitomicaceae bacterium]EHJ09387.1 Ribonucleotide reductase of class III (anaerobic), activating protein [Crocosphaera watsonii WH 0003]MCH2247433.1 radical SAM protein [Crocosphaera sp.]CCQ55287.1 Ribonucleotide reductase of class III (anaerobic), activating protein [Crocosphaera watsonii WH 0005]CCQ70984.1 Ribonucleotide reductase of class III (anaerobic), activating protein 